MLLIDNKIITIIDILGLLTMLRSGARRPAVQIGRPTIGLDRLV